MSVFRTKLYVQHLRSSFWFLLTAVSILSPTAFPVHYLTVTNIKRIWGKYIYIEAIQINSSSGIYKTNISYWFLFTVIWKEKVTNFSNFIWITLLFFWNKRLSRFSSRVYPLITSALKASRLNKRLGIYQSKYGI